MAVIEIWPGRKGWWTEILAPYLKEHGRYIAVQKREPKTPSDFPVIVSDFTTNASIRPKGGADLVLTFRNLHNWMKHGVADNAFKAFYAALKPGGILGLVDHHARGDEPQDPKARSGYVRQDYAIMLAKKAGFVFDGISEINTNARDTTHHPAGVWTLPPTLRLKDRNRAKYETIGESDRFTLRFRKPAL